MTAIEYANSKIESLQSLLDQGSPISVTFGQICKKGSTHCRIRKNGKMTSVRITPILLHDEDAIDYLRKYRNYLIKCSNLGKHPVSNRHYHATLTGGRSAGSAPRTDAQIESSKKNWATYRSAGRSKSSKVCRGSYSSHNYSNYRRRSKEEVYGAHGDVCIHCGRTGDETTIQSAHADQDGSNDSIWNIIPMCGSCHKSYDIGMGTVQYLQDRHEDLVQYIQGYVETFIQCESR